MCEIVRRPSLSDHNCYILRITLVVQYDFTVQTFQLPRRLSELGELGVPATTATKHVSLV